MPRLRNSAIISDRSRSKRPREDLAKDPAVLDELSMNTEYFPDRLRRGLGRSSEPFMELLAEFLG